MCEADRVTDLVVGDFFEVHLVEADAVDAPIVPWTKEDGACRDAPASCRAWCCEGEGAGDAHEVPDLA
tara:strand:- start:390 stop:593 length:204 start_codon:yes stop_codon:yes gene_type:complete